jgi:hypothetical protein
MIVSSEIRYDAENLHEGIVFEVTAPAKVFVPNIYHTQANVPITRKMAVGDIIHFRDHIREVVGQCLSHEVRAKMVIKVTIETEIKDS